MPQLHVSHTALETDKTTIAPIYSVFSQKDKVNNLSLSKKADE